MDGDPAGPYFLAGLLLATPGINIAVSGVAAQYNWEQGNRFQAGLWAVGGALGVYGAAAIYQGAFKGLFYEVFDRSMSQAHYAQLLETGRLPWTRSGTFISPSREYARGYRGVTVQFNVEVGTTDSLLEIGVRNAGLRGNVYDNLPLAQRGWGSNNEFFKKEGDVINIGLGRGQALDIFNDNILSFSLAGRP